MTRALFHGLETDKTDLDLETLFLEFFSFTHTSTWQREEGMEKRIEIIGMLVALIKNNIRNPFLFTGDPDVVAEDQTAHRPDDACH